MIATYNEYHLGDNLIHLNYLRQACRTNPDKAFIHHCNPLYHAQLEPICEDVPITLGDLYVTPGAVHAWIGHANYFYEHPHRRDWLQFHLDWFVRLSSILEIENPMKEAADFLFDYPDLGYPFDVHFDYLIINAPPASNQLLDFDPQIFQNKVMDLQNQGKTVITTHPTGICESTLERNLTVTGIGALSKNVSHIIAVDTGPLWTTFNKFNVNKVFSRTIYGTTSDCINLAPNTICYQTLKK
jgi:hypothetical protein